MEVEKIYHLVTIEIKYGKRILTYNSNTWHAYYCYKDELISYKPIDVARFWKVLHKYHSSKNIPDIVAPQVLTVKESR